MHFLVVGPGAMGCLFAARLKRAGYDVALLDYNEKRADLINNQGIVVEGVTGEYTEKVPTVTQNIPLIPDVILIFVKADKTKEAGKTVKQWLVPETVVITLQNGIGNVETLEKMFGNERIYGGITAEGATLLGPGKIKHAGQGETVIGSKGKTPVLAEKIIKAFSNAGFQARSANNVNDLIWGKLVINVGINALSAITRLKNGRLPEIRSVRGIMEEAIKEAIAIANAKKIDLPYPDPLGRVMEVCNATAGNISSMLQDILNEKTTEVDFINGAILREGKSLGIPTPVNFILTSLIHAIQETNEERIC